MEENIIEFVRENQIIYDKKHGAHRNQTLKDKKWMELSKKLNVPVNTLKNRWKTIRDRFIRVRKECASGRKPTSPNRKKYKYYKSLLFLCDVDVETSNMRTLENFAASDEEPEIKFSEFEAASPYCFNEARSPTPSDSAHKRKDSESSESEMLNVSKSINSSAERKVTPFRTFLESIALTVEEAKFTLSQITRLQMGILQLVQNEIEPVFILPVNGLH